MEPVSGRFLAANHREKWNSRYESRYLSVTGIRFLSILSRRGIPPLLRSAYRSFSPDPDGVSTFHACETRPGWVPPIPRGQRCSHDQRWVSGRRSPPLPAARPYYPVTRPAFPGSRLRGIIRGSLLFTRPAFSLPGYPRTERGPLGFFPELRTSNKQGL